MAITNEDIKERFQVNDQGVICWRAVDGAAVPRWARAAAAAINKKAGEPVTFWAHANNGTVTKLYSQHVFETRIRKVLLGQTAVDASEKRGQDAKRRAKAAKQDAERAAKQPTPEEAVRASDRLKAIKVELGFRRMPTGFWHHDDGRIWSDVFFKTAEGIAAAAKVDGETIIGERS